MLAAAEVMRSVSMGKLASSTMATTTPVQSWALHPKEQQNRPQEAMRNITNSQ